MTHAKTFCAVAAGMVIWPLTAGEIYSTSFESAEGKEYVLRSEAALADHEGIDDSRALKITRSDKSQYSVSGISLGKITPGSYTLTMKFRAENIRDAQGKASKNVQVMALEYYNGKKYLSQNSTFFKVPPEGKWETVQFSFQVPPEANRTGLSLFLRKGMTGTVWLDDIRITDNTPETKPAESAKPAVEQPAGPLTVEKALKFPDENANEVVYSTSFEPAEGKKYTLRAGAELAAQEGFNGTTALKISRSDSKQYSVSGCALGKLEPGTYTLTMKLKAENIRTSKGAPSPNVQVMAFEHYNNGKYLSQNSQFFKVPPPGKWSTVKYTFKTPENATRTSLSFFLRKGMTGTVWIDDVVVSKNSGEIPAVNLLKPENLTVFGDRVQIVLNGTVGTPAGSTILVTLGKESKLVENGGDGLFKIDFDNLALGTLPLEIKTLDLKNQTVQSKCSFNLFVKPPQTAPDYAVRFDQDRNLLVNGKPYMIVGIYGPHLHAKEIAEGGFNTIIDYTLFGDKGEKINRVANIRKRMDELHSCNLKALLSVQHQFPGRPSASTAFDDVSGVYECVTAAAEGVKDHPALLGYYVSDEMPRDGLPMVRKIREAVSVADPWHPTYTLTCRVEDMPVYAHTGDVIGMDPYPITSRPGNHSIKDVAEQTELCVKTGQPVWVVNQAFSWAVYDGTPAEQYVQSRKLTADEMLAMPLLAAVCGAKGFIFYSYDGAVIRTAQRSPEDAAANWAALRRAAGVLNGLAPFILNGKTKDIAFEANQGGQLRGKVFEDGQGNVRVILVGVQNKAVARFRLPEYPVLKSMTGLTRHQGGGRYEINVDGVQFDILSNEKPSA